MELSATETAILEFNRLAMESLKSESFVQSLSHLKQAERQTLQLENEKLRSRLLGITYNNFGCYYKRKKQFKVALEYLNKALYVEKLFNIDEVNLASTHLNISALYSSLKRHEAAFLHSQTALTILQEAPKSIEQQTSLVISHFNAGVELEHMNRVSESLEFYKNGWNIASVELGADHQLTENIASTFRAAQSRVDYFNGILEYRENRRNNSRVCPHTVDRKFIENESFKKKGRPVRKFWNKRRSASPNRDLDYKLPETFFKPYVNKTEFTSSAS